ncbi:MAG: acyl-CoA dehydratase activase-related protein [Minisyncoccales bacterium]
MKIGIPKSLFYYKKPIFFQEFFKALNCQIVFSPETNKTILEAGTKISDPETCYSIKVFFGHLLFLENQCDYIFIPLLKKNEELFEYCPKFFGLPDLAKNILKTKILSALFEGNLEKFALLLGEKLGKKKREIREALKKAISKELEDEEKRFFSFQEKMKSNLKKIVLVSHPYNLCDSFVNFGIEEKLEKLNLQPIFLQDIPYQMVKERNVSFIPQFHWEFGEEIMKKLDFILGEKIDAVIEISSFACGCDAVLKEFVEKMVKSFQKPFLYLILDEQTGEAGFQTRLEAFADSF